MSRTSQKSSPNKPHQNSFPNPSNKYQNCRSQPRCAAISPCITNLTTWTWYNSNSPNHPNCRSRARRNRSHDPTPLTSWCRCSARLLKSSANLARITRTTICISLMMMMISHNSLNMVRHLPTPRQTTRWPMSSWLPRKARIIGIHVTISRFLCIIPKALRPSRTTTITSTARISTSTWMDIRIM